MTPLEQEIDVDRESWLGRENMHLDKLLEKANKEKKMLQHMAYHYFARNKSLQNKDKEPKTVFVLTELGTDMSSLPFYPSPLTACIENGL